MYFGYFTFTDTVSSDVLKSIAEYAHESVILQLANVSMIILIIAHYPATEFGARKAIESFFWKDAPLWGSIVIVYVLIGMLATPAISIKELATVLDFTSSLAGSFVILMLPAAMALYINNDKNLSWKH